MDCRTSEKRRKIVMEYNIEPVAHIQLLKGQIKYSDAGAVIENDYYIFEAVHRDNGNKEYIKCGMGAARDFLRLIKHAGLPVFNPLRCELDNNREYNCDGANVEFAKGKWNPAAKQLYNAIMWLIIAFDAKPGTPLFEFERDVVTYKKCEPFPWKVKRVNTVIQRVGEGRTLTEIINAFVQNNDVRDDVCRFDFLIRIINNYTNRDGESEDIQSFF